jgi:hypothetical protein
MRQSRPILKLLIARKGKLKECIVKGELWTVPAGQRDVSDELHIAVVRCSSR